ncbi:radical SAM protein [Tumebacillus sp. ITR2]|uniref:Radical SAM protein n=1 Tax=Tumebacillus amylolyticus TaxID=2801339 RepID=A0ABS1JDA0_9BACL|nr:radical SAM protein [Tumebacillus amylolyticus]MBL0388257.1 radical SAM protein [Tumebacillus amylolyticus]
MLYATQYIYDYKLEDETHVILNTLTGALDVVSERTTKLLKSKGPLDPALFDADELEVLTERGYLLPHDEERAQVATWFSDYAERMKAFHFIVCPTFTCNLRCPYCFEDLEIRQSKTRMSDEQVEKMYEAMDRLIEMRGAEYAHLQLYGGEPFLRANRDLVSSIIERAVSKGWGVSGITNGTQIDAYFDLFERLPAGTIEQIQITMDGPEEMHNQLRIYADGRGSYEEIKRNVTRLLELEVPVLLRVNTGIDNVSELPRLVQSFEDNGWTQHPHFQCQIAPITDHGCTGCVPNYQPEFKLMRQLHELFENWEEARERYHLMLGYDLERRTSLLRRALYGTSSELAEAIDLSGCSASRQHYVVFGAEGLLYACPETVGMTEIAIGRYAPEYELDTKSWNKWAVNISNTSKCASCNIAPVCGGACPLQGFNSSSFDAYEPHCNFAQQSIKSYLDLNKSRVLELLEMVP